MDRVFNANTRSLGEIEAAAVAIKRTRAERYHIGLLYRHKKGQQLWFLHLAFDLDLRNDPPTADYLWIDPNIPRRRLRQLAAVCRRIAQANEKGIPYAFDQPNDCFDTETAEFLLGPTRLGLTCASFVLAVLDYARLPLLVYGTWPMKRPGDLEAQREFLALLRDHGKDEQSVRQIEGQIPAVRYRPEEVAAASTCSPWPVEFLQALERTKLLLPHLN